MRERYWLSRNCFVCVIGEDLMCLDLKRRKYSMYKASYTNTLRDRVSGWPIVETSDETRFGVEDVIADLTHAGILVPDRSHGKDATPVSIVPPKVVLLEEYEQVASRVTLKDTIHFTRAIVAGIRIPGLRLPSLARRIQRRRPSNHHTKVSSEPSSGEVEEMRHIVSAFERLRPLLLKARNQQWSEQFILLKLMAYQGHHPLWILGVAKEPFSTCSWLQCGSMVIDVAPEVAATFTPIFAA